MRIAFIGAAGLPNRYGGFESFLEACAPILAKTNTVTVTCDAAKYPDRTPRWRGVQRLFLAVPANGAASVFHDIVAFTRVVLFNDAIVVLGVSAGVAFPVMRLICLLLGKTLIVNVDGVEWRRAKFGRARQAFLRLSDSMAQIFAHKVVVDSAALLPFLTEAGRRKATCIAYSGDQVVRLNHGQSVDRDRLLTICRIEPENNCHLLLQAVAQATTRLHYDFIGNWHSSDYGRDLWEQYHDHPSITLHGPIYDEQVIAGHRERCAIYLHGHSVGGTNPSLVEMLYYDCLIIAFDCPFNRETAGDAARYFTNVDVLGRQLHDAVPHELADRAAIRERYTRATIAAQYLDVIGQD